jgi:hypothetical protein
MNKLIEDFQDPGEVMEPCIICGSDSGCEHVVFIFDRSFTEFVAGQSDEVHRIAEVVSAIFLGWLNENREVRFRGGSYDHHLRELFGYAEDNFTAGEDYIAFDWTSFMELVLQLLEEELGVMVFPFGSGGAPGFDSAMVVCYAENPAGVLDEVERIIRGYLEKAAQSSSGKAG